MSNTGNTTLANLVLEAPLISNGSITGCGLQALAPAAKVTCVAQYTVTQADVAAGQVVNEATARAIGPAGAGEIVAKNTLTISVSTGPTDEEVQKSFENLTGGLPGAACRPHPAERTQSLRLARPRQRRGAGRAGGQPAKRRQRHRRQLLGKPAGHACARFGTWPARACLTPRTATGSIASTSGWRAASTSYSDPDEDDDRKGQFGIVHTGVDYRISQDVLLGILASVDWTKEKTDVVDGEVDGTGWMVGPLYVRPPVRAYLLRCPHRLGTFRQQRQAVDHGLRI